MRGIVPRTLAAVHVETVGPEATAAPEAHDLVLLHGGTGTGRSHWQKLLGDLKDTRGSRGGPPLTWRVHLPDLPGHGRSPIPDGVTYTRDLLVAALEELLDELGPPVHVAGFSMGGHTALALAARRPELFASLVLIGVNVRDHAGLREWRAAFDPERYEAANPLLARHLAKLHAPLGEDAWRDVLRRDSAGDLGVDVDLDALRALTCPVLLVRGDRDRAVEPSQYAELRAVWPQADECVIPAGGHDVQMTRHRLVREPLLDFLGRVLAG